MKSEIVQALKAVKRSHLKWVVHASKLLDDIDESQAVKPLLCTQCDFGEWYYSVGCKINNLPGMKRLEHYHEDFHDAYKALYFAKFDRRVSQGPRKLFSKKYHVPITPTSSLEDKFELLKVRYDVLYKETRALEKIVSVMNEKLFDKDRHKVSSP